MALRKPTSLPAPAMSGLALLSQPLLPQVQSPPQNALMAKIASLLSRFPGVSALTTERGVAGSASPAVSGMMRQQQTWDRRRLIPQFWALYRDNPRFHAAVEKHVYKATATGFNLAITAREGTTDAAAKRAQTEADAFLRRTRLVNRDGTANVDLMAKYLRHGRMEADMFVQNVIAWNANKTSGEIVKRKVMPSMTMERLSDDTDEFLDPERAFVQIDLSTQQVVPGGEFAEYQISHHRWKQLGEDRYGQFEYASTLGIAHNLDVLEAYQETRRKSNAARIEDHTLGEVGNNQTKQKDIDEYKKAIGVMDKGAIVDSDPYQQLAKYVHDANVDIKVHPSDPTVHEIADLIYFLEKEGAANGTPIQLFGQNLANMSRDTLDLIVSEWLDGMAYDLCWVYEVILDGICLQLELKGINPDSLNISLANPKRVFESAADCIAFVTKALAATLGAGMNAKPSPLITLETAVAMLSEYIGIDNSKKYVAELEKMLTDKHMDADTV
ncbi:MAG: hypothetical protein ACRYFS_24385, partial [Janthinobacterium lividum]